jgi:hypothetical protein
VSGAGLINVDTAELILAKGIDDDIGDDLPLRALKEPELWEKARREWGEAHPREWTLVGTMPCASSIKPSNAIRRTQKPINGTASSSILNQMNT